LIQKTNWAKFGDDPSVVTPSVVSDSAPLLTNLSRNSSSSVVNQPPSQQRQAQTILVRPKPFSRRSQL
jgi:hypothetical protein